MDIKSKPSHNRGQTIELNGQIYDARTGSLIRAHASQPAQMLNDIAAPYKSNHLPRNKTPSHHIHKTAQPSKTLMRQAVKRPHTVNTVTQPEIKHEALPVNAQKHDNPALNRLERAEKVPQSSLISRFGDVYNNTHDQKVPTHVSTMNVVSEPHINAKPEIASVPVKSERDTLLDNSLRHATGHTAHALKKQKVKARHKVARKLGVSTKVINFAATSMAVFLLGGFIAYQNVPNLAVRYASMKAGVNATLPTYQPSGFAVSDAVQYGPGEIAVNYQANADDRNYTIRQKNTSWDSSALKENYVQPTAQKADEYSDKGRTIYIYDGTNATWVDKGVWYDIKGDTSLNHSQLIKIATSM